VEELAGRVAVVTGGASGIGRALAFQLAAERMSVVLADIEQTALDACAADLAAATGAEVAAVVTDVSDPEAVEALAAVTVERFGAVHVVCNNAGVVTMGPGWEQPLADWRWVLGVDLWGVVNGMRTFVPIMLRQGEPAHVVNTASIAGLVPSPTITPYNVAKAGVVALSESLAMELAELGAPIGVSVLCPGVVPTRIAESSRNRPGRGAGDLTPVLDLPTQVELPSTAWTPEQIAARVVAAIRSDEFWIVTHEGSAQLIATRAAGITSGGRPVAPPVF
jgi:NAD(P)-dependent dehydrogenase (short-subunit alcohol dehydrogenase family)